MKTILGIMLIIIYSICKTVHAEDNKQHQGITHENHEAIFQASMSKRSTPKRPFSNNRGRKDLSSCKHCGLINPENDSYKDHRMIINGTIVDPPYKYPWMVRLMAETEDFHLPCTGTIINEYYILTAAHCLVKKKGRPENVFFDPTELSVEFLTDTYDLETGPETEAIIPYPEYDKAVISFHDIGLVKLKSKITCNKFRNPICLPPPKVKFPYGKIFVTAGWGATYEEEFKPKSLKTRMSTTDTPTTETLFNRKLREGLIKYVNVSNCLPSFFDEIGYCFVGLPGNWQSPCYGDSGGPAFYKEGEKYYQAGITSGSMKMDTERPPFLYGIVSKYLDWIKEVTGTSPEKNTTLHVKARQQKKTMKYARRPKNRRNEYKNNEKRILRRNQGRDKDF